MTPPEPLSGAPPERIVLWKRFEWTLLGALVLLKTVVVVHTWGHAQGFDAGLWLETFDATRWFQPLPAPRALAASYHPPLSYLIARLPYALYPHAVQISQLVAAASVMGAVLSLRSVVRRVGWLWTVPGLWLVYGFASIPLIVWQGIETSYDGLSLFWFVLALELAVRLHWDPPTSGRWRQPRFLVLVTGLGLTLAAGMLTKYSGLMAFGLPFLVVMVRRGPKGLLRECAAPVVAAIIAVVVVSPLYVKRYYRTEGSFMPSAMEWIRGDVLPIVRAKRDAAPAAFIAEMLRPTPGPLLGTQISVRTSLPHSTWLQTWARDSELGTQAPFSLQLSGIYIVVFAVLLLGGTLMFLGSIRHVPPEWRHLGWVMLTIFVVWLASALAFGWRYPMWDWQVFKAKYVSPYVLWIVFASGAPLVIRRPLAQQHRLARWVLGVALGGLLVFMTLNHVVPVY